MTHTHTSHTLHTQAEHVKIPEILTMKSEDMDDTQVNRLGLNTCTHTHSLSLSLSLTHTHTHTHTHRLRYGGHCWRSTGTSFNTSRTYASSKSASSASAGLTPEPRTRNPNPKPEHGTPSSRSAAMHTLNRSSETGSLKRLCLSDTVCISCAVVRRRQRWKRPRERPRRQR